MPYDKVRIRFRKSGDLRLVSHLDLARAFERLMRRAALPLRMTEGFHPGPRMIFAQSLSLGASAANEVLELELTEPVEPAEVLQRLRDQSMPGIEFHSAIRIPIKTTARPKRAVYRLRTDDPAIAGQIADILSQTEIWVEREKPRPRQLDIRPYLESLTCQVGIVRAGVWLTQEGTIRINELLRLLNLPEDWPVERETIDIADELTPEELARIPEISPRIRPLNRIPTPVPEEVEIPRETWGATSNGPVVE